MLTGENTSPKRHSALAARGSGNAGKLLSPKFPPETVADVTEAGDVPGFATTMVIVVEAATLVAGNAI
jgi:hypothetical protein